MTMTPQEMLQTYPSTHFEGADKGGDVEIMNTDDYVNEANRQLSDKGNYTKSPNDPALQHNEMVNNTTERFQKSLCHYGCKMSQLCHYVTIVTMDVKSLHTSIPNHEDIAAVKERYYECIKKSNTNENNNNIFSTYPYID